MRLTERDQAIVLTVQRFRQVTASQIRRLHFPDGSDASRRVKQRRTLARLVKWGHLTRLPRPMGGYLGGSEGYVYMPVGSKTRHLDAHTLDITELYVSLDKGVLAFEPEPYCHVQIGHLELKPDAYLRIQTDATYQYFIEVDRGTEWRPQLHNKMKRYCQAYNHWTEPTFPLVLFVVPDETRARLVESVIKRQESPGLFEVTSRPLDRLQ